MAINHINASRFFFFFFSTHNFAVRCRIDVCARRRRRRRTFNVIMCYYANSARLLRESLVLLCALAAWRQKPTVCRRRKHMCRRLVPASVIYVSHPSSVSVVFRRGMSASSPAAAKILTAVPTAAWRAVGFDSFVYPIFVYITHETMYILIICYILFRYT